MSNILLPSDLQEELSKRCSVCRQKLQFTEVDGIQYLIYEAICHKCNTTFRKRTGNFLYKKVGNDFYCVKCNSRVKVAKVLHPVFKKNEEISSFHEQEFVPYCERCESIPNPKGMALREKV